MMMMKRVMNFLAGAARGSDQIRDKLPSRNTWYNIALPIFFFAQPRLQ